MEKCDDVVLFDFFTHGRNLLGGRLVEKERHAEEAGDLERAAAWGAEDFAVSDEKKAIGPTNRRGRIEAILRWRARRMEITEGAGPAAPAT